MTLGEMKADRPCCREPAGHTSRGPIRGQDNPEGTFGRESGRVGRDGLKVTTEARAPVAEIRDFQIHRLRPCWSGPAEPLF